MKQIFGSLAAILMVSGSPALAFEESFFTVPSPNTLDAKTSVAGIAHGFSTKVVDTEGIAKHLDQNNFGFSGANVGASYRYNFVKGMDAHAFVGLRSPEVTAGAGITVPMTGFAPFAGFDGVVQRDSGKYRKSFFGYVGAGSDALESWHLIPSVAFAYDSYDKNFGAALALAVPFTEESSLVAEVIPHFTQEPLNFALGDFLTWSAGYRYSTGGHQFFFVVSDSPAVTFRQALQGAPNGSMNFAFRITRLF